MPDFIIIDNYDSFTYNLVHLCHSVLLEERGETGHIEVFRPNEITLPQLADKRPTAIIISPGPGAPAEASFSKAVIATFARDIPLFGVCLGMQAIAECFGAKVVRGQPLHGKKAPVFHDGRHPLFEDIPSPFDVVRYHSLKVASQSLGNANIKPLALTRDGTLMAMEVTTHPLVWGVQFHPESIGSDYGRTMMRNFYMAASMLRGGDMASKSTSSETCPLFSIR
jgi:anthranilate synthase/aminodeoxychorismate synthase-like glutamine amidotransferase